MFQRQMGGNPKQVEAEIQSKWGAIQSKWGAIQSKWGPIQLLSGLGRLGGFPAYLPASS